MDLTATYEFDAPVDKVWELLMNTSTIGECLPGCRGLQPIGEDTYEVELNVAVAAISGSFKGTVSLTDKVPPQSYKLSVEGTGRQGFVKGHARVELEPDGDRYARARHRPGRRRRDDRPRRPATAQRSGANHHGPVLRLSGKTGGAK